MTALAVVVMLLGFVILDVIVRTAGRRLEERRVRRERAAVLETAVRLDVSHEAPSLKRAEVPHAKARILAVDDEPVVLDSFRKILVLDGFSVDTVETGQEALGLAQRNDYDFVFTDLKMPNMDGVEVVKAIKHLRPDVDVAVVTGYATIESAVQTMQHGAVDYVQKPFTAQELTAFARALLVKRQARLEAQRQPSIRVVDVAAADGARHGEYGIPGGAFVSEGHCWARIESAGVVRVGLDDFARKALGAIERVELPVVGATLHRGDRAFAVHRGGTSVHFLAPIGGRVVAVNQAVLDDPSLVMRSPYEYGWVYRLEPEDVARDLRVLRIGVPVVEWYRQEVARLLEVGGPAERGTPQVDWLTLESRFFAPPAAAVA